MTIRTIPLSRPFPLPYVHPALRKVSLFARDLGVVLAVVGVYFLLRGAAPDRTGFAVDVSRHIVAGEKALGVFRETWVQDASLQHHAIQELANFVYAYMHFPVLAAVGVWVWWMRGRRDFAFIRNVMFISMVMGLVFYYAFPAAPPRLLAAHGFDFGFTDTVFGGDTAVNYAQPSLILNEYAAIPSFHFGWIALASAAIWIHTESRLVRTGAVALTVLMTWAIVASANHFFFDMALGGVVILASWKLARLIEARQDRELAEPIALDERRAPEWQRAA